MRRGILWLAAAVARVGLLAGCTTSDPAAPEPGSVRVELLSTGTDDTDGLHLWVEAPGRPETCSADLAVSSAVVTAPPGYETADGVRLNGAWVDVLR